MAAAQASAGNTTKQHEKHFEINGTSVHTDHGVDIHYNLLSYLDNGV